MMFLKYSYRTVLLFLFLSGCTPLLGITMNTISGAVGSLVTRKYEENAPEKLTVQKKNREKFPGNLKRKVPRFDY